MTSVLLNSVTLHSGQLWPHDDARGGEIWRFVLKMWKDFTVVSCWHQSRSSILLEPRTKCLEEKQFMTIPPVRLLAWDISFKNKVVEQRTRPSLEPSGGLRSIKQWTPKSGAKFNRRTVSRVLFFTFKILFLWLLHVIKCTSRLHRSKPWL